MTPVDTSAVPVAAPASMPSGAGSLSSMLDVRRVIATPDTGAMADAGAPGAAAAPQIARPITPRAFSCRCGRPVFFRNSVCLGCNTPLGYDPLRRELLPLQPAASPVAVAAIGTPDGGGGSSGPMSGQAAALPPPSTPIAPASPNGAQPIAASAGWWQAADAAATAQLYRRCSSLDTAAGCNWLIADGEPVTAPPLCRCCRLTRTLPDLSLPENAVFWSRIELAKRRLVSSLIGLNLPVAALTSEDPVRGLAFDLLHSVPGGPRVMTGHADGVITLDIEEADDATRERRRGELREPYRTLLGHLRHESGHYYWQRLVDGTDWHLPWRAVFGDERDDYTAALQRHYLNGPVADWDTRHVSAYASSHPWEDFAETWAHYLHMVDTLDTARSFGLDGARVELHYERFGTEVMAEPVTMSQAQAVPGADAIHGVNLPRAPQLTGGQQVQPPGPAPSSTYGQEGQDGQDAQGADFLQLLNGWMELTGVLNELSRSMGVPDFYPFVLTRPAVRKLHFVHRLVRAAGQLSAPSQPLPQT